MKRRSAAFLAAMLLASLAPALPGLPGPLAAVPALAAGDDGEAAEIPMPADRNAIVMNFENVDLVAFIRFISKLTGRNIVFGDKIEGTISVVSPTPVNVEQAYAMFQSVLSTQGLTTVDEGAVLRIVSTKDARTSGGSIETGGRGAAGFSTRLIPLRYVNANDIARVLAPQVSKDGAIVPYEGTNTVIVSDTSSNLARIADMVAAMDIPGHEQVIDVIPLNHAEAVRTSEQIVDILLGPSGGGGGGGGRRRGGGGGDKEEKNANVPAAQLGFKITPDERTNSLVVMAPSAEISRIRALARGLDTEIRPGEERVHVYYAKNADAESLVEVVSGIIVGNKQRARRDTKSSKKSDDLSPKTDLASSNSLNTSSLASAASPVSASDENMSITADPATNAVIVEGPNQEWKTILTLLQKLDIPRPQVFIEGIIVEASANKAKALGFDYQGAIHVAGGDILLRSNIAELGSAFINPLALGGLVAAAASDKQIQLPDGTEIPANYALLQALDATNDIEVLSAPTLLTLDNQEAEIIVGQNIPFVTGRTADITNIENVFTQVERKDVGIKLRVRPQVAEGDIVVLDVQQEVSAVIRTPQTEAQTAQIGPTTTIRSASTSVSVGDGRTVVIGGLISNRAEDGNQKVPLLGDIPWIGRLFQYKRKDNEKVNLIVFLTPHVIRTPKDLDFVSKDRRDLFRAQMRDPNSVLPGDDPRFEADGRISERDMHGEVVEDAHAVAHPAPVRKPVAAVRPAAVTTTKSKTETKVETKTTTETVAPAAGLQPASATAPPAAAPPSDTAPRSESSYRHTTSEKAGRAYPLDRDTRDRAPF